MQNKKILLD